MCQSCWLGAKFRKSSRLKHHAVVLLSMYTVEPHFSEHPWDQDWLFAQLGSVRSPGLWCSWPLRGGGVYLVNKCCCLVGHHSRLIPFTRPGVDCCQLCRKYSVHGIGCNFWKSKLSPDPTGIVTNTEYLWVAPLLRTLSLATDVSLF